MNGALTFNVARVQQRGNVTRSECFIYEDIFGLVCMILGTCFDPNEAGPIMLLLRMFLCVLLRSRSTNMRD